MWVGSWKWPCHSSHHQGAFNTQFTSQSMTYNLTEDGTTDIHVSTPSPWRSFHPTVNSRYKTGVNHIELHVMTSVLDVAFRWCRSPHHPPHVMNMDRTLTYSQAEVRQRDIAKRIHWRIHRNTITFRHHGCTQFDYTIKQCKRSHSYPNLLDCICYLQILQRFFLFNGGFDMVCSFAESSNINNLIWG